MRYHKIFGSYSVEHHLMLILKLLMMMVLLMLILMLLLILMLMLLLMQFLKPSLMSYMPVPDANADAPYVAAASNALSE